MGIICRAATTLADLSMAGLPTSPSAPGALKEMLGDSVLIGAALNLDQIEGRDVAALDIVKRHFTTISPEDTLKWQAVHPEPDRFDFEAPDRFVAFGAKHHLFVVGHVLVWHQQTPAWVFKDGQGGPVDRDTLLSRLRTHIQTVVGRFRGRIHGWDVVNEAFEDDGSWRKSPWYETLGEEYVAKAFELAREADPRAQLYYNDYNLWKPAKREATVRLLASLRARGIEVHGVGEQGHWLLDDPPVEQIEATVAAFAKAGLKLMITELDVDPLPRPEELIGADVSKGLEPDGTLDPYAQGLPEAVQKRLAERYAQVFAVFLRHPQTVSRVTLWGVTDATSWLNDWPVRGRTNHPLLWDWQGRPKPALDAVLEVLRKEP